MLGVLYVGALMVYGDGFTGWSCAGCCGGACGYYGSLEGESAVVSGLTGCSGEMS